MTKDYSMFEFPDFKVSKKHLEAMKASIKANGNLCPDEPIVVEIDTYQIIKGRYRFLACYDLQLPIYYKVSEVTTLRKAVATKHIHKNMAIEDVIKVYNEIPHYQAIKILHSEMGGFFNMKTVCSAIFECRQRYDMNVVHPSRRIDRRKLDSGLLGEWDYTAAKERLFRVKSFLQEFSQFGWTVDDAFDLLDLYSWEPTEKERIALKDASNYRWEVNLKNPRGSKISLQDAYSVLARLMRHERVYLTDYEIGCVQKLGYKAHIYTPHSEKGYVVNVDRQTRDGYSLLNGMSGY